MAAAHQQSPTGFNYSQKGWLWAVCCSSVPHGALEFYVEKCSCMHFKIFVKDIQDGGRCMFGAQIVAQTRDIFAIWKSVPISNINHYLKTHLEYSMKTDMDLNH